MRLIVVAHNDLHIYIQITTSPHARVFSTLKKKKTDPKLRSFQHTAQPIECFFFFFQRRFLITRVAAGPTLTRVEIQQGKKSTGTEYGAESPPEPLHSDPPAPETA